MAQTPAKKAQDHGAYIDFETTSATAAGDVVEFGTVPLIATEAIAANVQGAVCAEGVFDVPKNSDVFAAGDAVYWNSSATDLGSNTGSADNATGNLMGVCVAAANATVTHVRTKLTASKRTTTIGGAVTATDIVGEDASLNITGLAGAANTVGGTATVTAGAGGTGTSNGGATSMVGGAAGAVGGVGGALSILSGAGDATNGTAGAINIDSGAGATKGAITIATNAASLTFGAMPRIPVAAVAAAGANLATAGACSEGFNLISASDNTKGVALPSCVDGAQCMIVNMVTDKTLKIYPPLGKQVNLAGANNAITVAANSVGIYVSEGTNAWYGLHAATDVA
jgi:predicted RecA/RadA family phage recombinase